MHTRQANDVQVMVEVVPIIGVDGVQRWANCGVQYRYLVDHAGASTTLEYVELHPSLLNSWEHLCRGLSAQFLRVGTWLANTAELLAATDERRRRAGYER